MESFEYFQLKKRNEFLFEKIKISITLFISGHEIRMSLFRFCHSDAQSSRLSPNHLCEMSHSVEISWKIVVEIVNSKFVVPVIG